MWLGAGDQNASGYKATFIGAIGRFVTEKRRLLTYDFELSAPPATDARAKKSNSPAIYPAWQPAVSAAPDPFEIPLGTRFKLQAKTYKGVAKSRTDAARRGSMMMIAPSPWAPCASCWRGISM